jgi:hypothetical protein
MMDKNRIKKMMKQISNFNLIGSFDDMKTYYSYMWLPVITGKLSWFDFFSHCCIFVNL